MASTLDSPIPVRGKLAQVKNILDDANQKLQEEVSKYEIFATKSSANANSTTYQQRLNGKQKVPNELIKTISDISTLKSVLSCPIFNRIVNVTDTLDKLSYQLNLHPSIGPSDINIDANGELILAPPLEPSSLNNLINSRLDTEGRESSLSASQLDDFNNIQMNSQVAIGKANQLRRSSERVGLPETKESSCPSDSFPPTGRATANQPIHHSPTQNLDNYDVTTQDIRAQQTTNHSFGREKLVANGSSKTLSNGNSKQEQTINLNENIGDRSKRLYQTSGHRKSDALGIHVADTVDAKNVDLSTSVTHQNDCLVYNNGYSNEMYKTTHELVAQSESMAIEHQSIKDSTNFYSNSNIAPTNARCPPHPPNQSIRAQQNSDHHYLRNSCSPSTSVGSTVRLADECDSGASSYQSHTAKVASFNEHASESARLDDIPKPEKVDRMEQELINELSPDMERIKVTLEKDQNGLGITIAGYTCEKEEISGIFVKSITPNSPADLSGRIRTLDQIFAVNGRELLGFSNPEAVNVLRNTGKTVTLELMRYLAESKYQKLQTALAHAIPTVNARGLKVHNHDNVLSLSGTTSEASQTNPHIIEDHSANKLKSPVLISNNSLASNDQGAESIYKNEQVFLASSGKATTNSLICNNSTFSNNQVPVAAQRSGTNKVIETKQGARNTVEIKSPIYQLPQSSDTADNPKGDVVNSTRRDITENFVKNGSEEFNGLVPTKEPEWEKNAEFVELYKDNSQGLGFTVKEYADPKDPKHSIIMITSITPGGQAEKDGRLASGDLLIFVDDTDLKGASLNETVKALKRTSGQVRLGVLKLKSLTHS